MHGQQTTHGSPPTPARVPVRIACALLLTISIPAALFGEEPNDPESHWAFLPVARPALPESRDTGWKQDDLDQFILTRLEQEGLSPAPRADARTLMRRLSFALIGLPPTPEDLERYLKDSNPPDLEGYVDSLLASEEFGVHWARHWLDHVRYRPFPGRSESNDPYRLWVVKAFNEDLPLDTFLKMQIAGDLMPGPHPDEQVHLDGMVAVRPFSLKSRHHQQVDLLGRTFMGLSLACAECHDHKLEPLSREDYYAIRGIYESSQVIKAPYLASKEEFEDYMSGLARKQQNETRMKKELKDFGRVSQLMDLRERIEREEEKLHNPKEERNHPKIAKNLEKMRADEKKRMAEIEKRGIRMDAPESLEFISLTQENREFDAKWKEVYQFDAFVDQSDSDKIRDTSPPKEGTVVEPGDDPEREPPVPRRFPVILAGEDQVPLGARTEQSGRLELAEWLTSSEHPITARLMVNRIWYYLLGEGIVSSLSNFGHSGATPTHPALLDYLSDEFVKSNWSTKQLIRRIVVSSTFQQESRMDLDRDERDRRLALFGLARSKRLEAESIWRTMNWLEHDPESGEKRRDPNHELVAETASLFDGGNSSLILPRRSASVSTLQALFFMNSRHIRSSTEKIATRLHKLPDDRARIERAHLFLYGREADDEEIGTGLAFLDDWSGPIPQPERRSKDGPSPETLAKWQTYLQVLLATNEFLFVE